MKAPSNVMGNVGMTMHLCDNPNCKKPMPIVIRDSKGREFCSNKCLKEFEEGNMQPSEAEQLPFETNASDNETEPETETTTGPKKSRTKKASKKMASTAIAPKKTAAKSAAKKGKATTAKRGSATRLTGEEKITVLKLECGMRGQREQAFKAIKNGMTVNAAAKAITAKVERRSSSEPVPTGYYLSLFKSAGLIKIA